MNVKQLVVVSFAGLLALVTSPVWALAQEHAGHVQAAGFEVWVIDQSDTTADGGGTLYIYPGDAAAGIAADAAPEAIDLGGAASALCLAQTGALPKRPHMLLFNHAHTHALLTFVATGHVLFLDALTREPLTCLDVGEQAHAAHPSHDQTYAVVANQNGKLLQRIATDYADNVFTIDDAATLNLATCMTPSGALCEDPVLRPDNAPICPLVESGSRLTFVTLRGGGLFVVDAAATPMAIVAEYDAATVGPNGCGGIETAGRMYLNAGGGAPANPHNADLYAFDLAGFGEADQPLTPNTPAPRQIFSHDDRGAVDSHGAALVGDYLWLADRAANLIVVVDTRTDAVVNEIALAGPVSADPAPDLMDAAPDEAWVFVALRGPKPLTANVPEVNNAVGATPGLGILRVVDGGQTGEFAAIFPIANSRDGLETADPHAVAVRRV